MANTRLTSLYNIEITIPPDCGEALTEEEIQEALYDIADMSTTITVTHTRTVDHGA